MATRIRALEFPRETVDAVLGHSEGRLARTYQVYDHLAEKTTALKAWERELARVLAGRRKGSHDVLAPSLGARPDPLGVICSRPP